MNYRCFKYRGSIPKELHPQIIKMYLGGNSVSQIVRRYKKYSATASKIHGIFKKNNIKVRSNKENYKQKLDHSFFRTLNNEKKAYWLGLLAADGQIQHPKYSSFIVRIDLIEEDKYLLKNFVRDLQWKNGKVNCFKRKEKNCKNIARVVIKSDEMSKDLAKYGIVERKTFKLKFPSNIPKKLINHFCRGYFDGDGCITGKKDPTFKIVGTEQFLIEMQKILMKKCNLHKTKLQTRHKKRDNCTRSLEYGGIFQTQRIRNWLYKDASIWMKRKRNKFDALTKR